jgi:hypothetical protein
MENLISSFDIVSHINKGETVWISTNNCYSSTQYKKAYEFLNFVQGYELYTGQKVFFKKETFAKNRLYFSVVNQVFANIETSQSH